MLKFVAKGATSPTNVGVRTFPHETFGVSRESPDHFKQKHSIVKKGYFYSHDKVPQLSSCHQKKEAQGEMSIGSLGEKLEHCGKVGDQKSYNYNLRKGRFS